MKSPTPGQILYTKYPKAARSCEKGFDDDHDAVVTVRLTGETNSRGCWEFTAVWD